MSCRDDPPAQPSGWLSSTWFEAAAGQKKGGGLSRRPFERLQGKS